MIKDVLFWEKFRPQRIEQIILLPRIKKFINDGIQTNILLHGHMGTGKSSLIRILLKDKSFKKINASLNNGVDLLREELFEYCTSRISPFNKSNDKMKYVYLEEFDRSTSAFQEAFKSPAALIVMTFFSVLMVIIQVSQGIIYFSQKEQLENISAKEEINQIGEEDNEIDQLGKINF